MEPQSKVDEKKDSSIGWVFMNPILILNRPAEISQPGWVVQFHELISRLETAEGRISKLMNMSIETSETEKQREKMTGKKKPNKTEQNFQ